jgi:hypothetical protein
MRNFTELSPSSVSDHLRAFLQPTSQSVVVASGKAREDSLRVFGWHTLRCGEKQRASAAECFGRSKVVSLAIR